MIEDTVTDWDDGDHDVPHPAGRIELVRGPAIGARVLALTGTTAVLGLGILTYTAGTPTSI